MSIKQRMLSIKLSDKIKRNPLLANELGIELKFQNSDKEKRSLK